MSKLGENAAMDRSTPALRIFVDGSAGVCPDCRELAPLALAAGYTVVQCVPAGSRGLYRSDMDPFGSSGLQHLGSGCGGARLRAWRQTTRYMAARWLQERRPLVSPGGFPLRATECPLSEGASLCITATTVAFAAAYFEGNGAPPISGSRRWEAGRLQSLTATATGRPCFRGPLCSASGHPELPQRLVICLDDQLHRRSSRQGRRRHLQRPAPFYGGVVRGVQSLHTTETDGGGGARTVNIFVNGIRSKAVDFCPPDYGGSYTALKPCPDSSNQQLAIDTREGSRVDQRTE